MNEQLAEKFAAALAQCATTGCSAEFRKEAAASKLIKEALSPIAGVSPYAYMPLLGATVSGLGSYLTTQDEKKKMRNALYGAGIGGLVGLSAPAIGDAFKAVSGDNSPLAAISATDPAVSASPDVQAAATAAKADHAAGVPHKQPAGLNTPARLGVDAAAGAAAYRLTPGGRAGELGRAVKHKTLASNPAYQQLQEVLNARSKGTAMTDILHPAGGPLSSAQSAEVKKMEKLFGGLKGEGSLGTRAATRRANLQLLEKALVERAARIKPKGGPKLTGNQMNLSDFNAVRRGGIRRGAAGVGAAAATDAAIQWFQNYMAGQEANRPQK
jgi:hypothetical protein